ncbi:MAG: shikimate kinase [Lachnospiraceae bacterium]|nr:shikimate kinase [Lachnospiraceae bacterium]
MRKKSIVLIGMPGVGKSTIGVVLAKNLGISFIDSDLVIQEREEKKLYELIEEHGLEGFLDIEGAVNASLNPKAAVIATGGSAVYRDAAMRHLSEIGVICYLQLSCESIAERLGDLTERGVALKDGKDLAQLYAERVPLYEKYANMTVDCENKNIREIVFEIAKRIKI